METIAPTRKQIAAALRVMAALLVLGQAEDSITCTTRQAEVLAAGMTEVTVKEWTGDSGWQYRTYTGTLWGRPVKATHLIEES